MWRENRNLYHENVLDLIEQLLLRRWKVCFDFLHMGQYLETLLWVLQEFNLFDLHIEKTMAKTNETRIVVEEPVI